MSHTCGHTALQMEAEQSHMTEMICDLALEIIYLLTGEKHAAVKMASIEGLLRGVYPPLSVGGGQSQTPIMKPPAHSWIPESNNQKILEVTNRIMELLVGEVSGAGNSGAGCSFMEERGNGEKDHRLHTAMEDQPHLTSQDVSRKRNQPDRHPRSLYSSDSSQNNQEIPHHGEVIFEMKIKEEVKEEPEDLYVRGDERCMEEEISPNLSLGSAQEGYNPAQQAQDDEVLMRGGEQEEEISPHVRADWGHIQDTQEQPHYAVFNNEMQSDSDIASYSLDAASPNLQPIHTQKTNCFSTNEQLSNLGKDNNGEQPCPTMQRNTHTADKLHSCSECGKCFVKKSKLTQHRKTHTGEKPYLCLECGKCFYQKSNLNEHKKTHTGEKPYSCSECGKCFSQKAVLIRHERVHTGEKPYSCTECGRSFSRNSHLTDHKRIHTGEKVYSCSECGKSFTQKSNLNTHKKSSHREEIVFIL